MRHSNHKIYIVVSDNMDNMDKNDVKVKVELDRDVVNELIKLKEVGDTYSDVVKRLLPKSLGDEDERGTDILGRNHD